MHIPRFILVKRFYFILFFEAIPVLVISTVSLMLIVSHEIFYAVYILSRKLGGLSLGSCPEEFSEELSRKLKNKFL